MTVGDVEKYKVEPTGVERMKTLYFFARLFGMPKEKAQAADYLELRRYVDSRMKPEDLRP